MLNFNLSSRINLLSLSRNFSTQLRILCSTLGAPVSSGPCSSSLVAAHSSKPTRHHRGRVGRREGKHQPSNTFFLHLCSRPRWSIHLRGVPGMFHEDVRHYEQSMCMGCDAEVPISIGCCTERWDGRVQPLGMAPRPVTEDPRSATLSWRARPCSEHVQKDTTSCPQVSQVSTTHGNNSLPREHCCIASIQNCFALVSLSGFMEFLTQCKVFVQPTSAPKKANWVPATEEFHMCHKTHRNQDKQSGRSYDLEQCWAKPTPLVTRC